MNYNKFIIIALGENEAHNCNNLKGEFQRGLEDKIGGEGLLEG